MSIATDNNSLHLCRLAKTVDMKNSITYVGIGCACNAEWSIEEDQQYPIFIRHIKEKNNDLKLNLILIDPLLEKIPNLTGKCKCEHYENVIVHENNICVYKFNNTVVYTPQLMTFEINDFTTPENEVNNTIPIDITNILEQINKKCLKENGVLIVHDFSGMDIWILDKYFGYYTRKYHNKILYDLSDGNQRGCFLDMTDTINHVSFHFENGYIEMKSHKTIAPDKFNEIIENKDSTKIMVRKIERLREKLFYDFMVYLHNYRRAILWRNSIANNDKDVDTKKRVLKRNEIMLFDVVHKTKLLENYMSNNVYEFVMIMRELFDEKKRELENVYKTKINMDENEPNKWMNEIDKITRK